MSDPFANLRPWQSPHVKHLLKVLLTNKAALDASDLGTGKCFSACAIARIMGVTPFVLGPKNVRSDWEDAAAQMGLNVEFHNYEKIRSSNSPFGVEKPWGKGSFWEWKINPTLMVFDECHRCGGSTTITGKLLRAAPKAAEFVLCLSATAADNPKHLKNLGQVLGLFSAKRYQWWLMENGCPPDWTGRPTFVGDYDEEAGRAALAKIHTQIFPARGSRMRKRDIPTFPQMQVDIRFYEALNADPERLAKMTRSSSMQDRIDARREAENDLVEHWVDDIDLALDNGTKALCFLNFTDCLDKLADLIKKRGWSYGIIDGRQTGAKGDAERRDIKKAFQRNELDVLIANNQAGSEGMSCHDPTGRVDRTEFVSPAETGRRMKQVTGRACRDGGAYTNVWFGAIKGTYQHEILLTNRKKLQNIDTLNDAEAENIVFS